MPKVLIPMLSLRWELFFFVKSGILLPRLVARQWAVRQYSPSSPSYVALYNTVFDKKGVCRYCHSEEDGTSDVRISFGSPYLFGQCTPELRDSRVAVFACSSE